MKFGAYLDTYYAYDFNDPVSNQRPYVTQYDRHNEFSINHAWIRGAYESENIRSSLAIQLGTYPANNYGAEPTWAQMIYEGFAGYKITENSWLDVGVFGGHFGYESALSLDRELLSPALATEYTPYYQSGIRYTYEVSQSTQVRAVVLNGWQNIQETNNNKSVGVAIDHQFNDMITASYGNYYGKDISAQSNVWRLHNNALLKLAPTDELTFVAVIDWTLQDAPLDNGNYQATFLTLMSNYNFTDEWSIAGRFEQVNDDYKILISTAYPDVNQTILSISVNYYPTSNVALKLEPKLYTQPTMSAANDKSPLVIQGGFSVRLE
ncbi:MAG: outer membrane beta-barrel protein [Marinoscillum sp.]